MPVFNNALAGAAGQSGGDSAYQISKSLRFNAPDSPKLSRTLSATVSTYTVSLWVKRVELGRLQIFWDLGTNALLAFRAGDELSIYDGATYHESTTLHRDTSAWMHLVLSVNNGTGTLNVNNAALVSNVSNLTGGTNAVIGEYAGGSYDFNGYIAELHFVSDQALSPTDFAETNDFNAWVPKRYTGSYGTDGSYLDFSNSSSVAALGYDASGSNNWTPNSNFSVTTGFDNDSVPDSPTNNFATMNPNHKVQSVTLSDGNLAVNGTNDWRTTSSTMALTSGKWLAECTIETVGGSFSAGVGNPNTTYIDSYMGQTPDSWTWFAYNSAGLYNNGAYTNTSNPWNGAGMSYPDTVGDVLGLALDLDAGTLKYYLNGTLIGTAFDNITGPVVFQDGSNGTWVNNWNFGQQAYSYPVSGYKAVCTDNLGEVETASADYFDVVTYPGDNSYPRNITELSFKPSFVWTKSRNASYRHMLFDSIRGVGKNLTSNSSAVQSTNDDYGYVSSFNSDGWTIAEGATSGENFNQSTKNYVAFAWNGGDLATNNAYNQSQTWSDSVTNPNGAYGVASNAFNGDLTTHASPNSTYPMTYTNPSASSTVISTFRIYTAIYETSGITLELNGTDISKSAMENTLHQNGSTLVVTKSAILQLSAGDYIEIMWATDSTSGYLEAVAATSFAPATPSATISMVRLHG